MNIENLSAKQLRQAATLKDRIDSLQSELSKLLGGTEVGNGMVPEVTDGRKKKRKMSAAAKAKIAAAQRARWAKVRAGKK
jgi:hypothetical protein